MLVCSLSAICCWRACIWQYHGIDARCVGCHHWVLGQANLLVGLGTYVHVEVVYSQGCHARYADDGSANPLGVPLSVRDETSVAIGGELGVRSIGKLEGYCLYGEQFSAIVWGKNDVHVNEMGEDKLCY